MYFNTHLKLQYLLTTVFSIVKLYNNKSNIKDKININVQTQKGVELTNIFYMKLVSQSIYSAEITAILTPILTQIIVLFLSLKI